MIVLPDRGRPIAYDLRGSATNVELRRLPKSVRAPQLDALLSVADYHVKGSGGALSGSATFNESQVEGATVAADTVVEFDTGDADRADLTRVDTVAQPLSYAARGTLHGMDVRRLGKALDIRALEDDRYDGRVNGILRPAGIRDVARRADPVCERHAHRLGHVGHSRVGDDVQDRHRRQQR